VNRDVHGRQANCGSFARASRFLIGLVTCFATHDGIPAVARDARARYVLGGTPTNSVKRVLKVPSEEQPTAKQTSVTLRSPRRSNAIARSMRRVIK
jgi:hypothetical protein